MGLNIVGYFIRYRKDDVEQLGEIVTAYQENGEGVFVVRDGDALLKVAWEDVVKADNFTDVIEE